MRAKVEKPFVKFSAAGICLLLGFGKGGNISVFGEYDYIGGIVAGGKKLHLFFKKLLRA